MPHFLDPFYATGDDLRVGLRAVEAELRVDYVLHEMSPEPKVKKYSSGCDLPNLGISITGEYLLEPRYFVVLSGMRVAPTPIPQRRGGTLYKVSIEECPGNMIFHPGGLYGENVLIYGELGPPKVQDDVSKEIYRVFRVRFFEAFEKTLGYHIGPEAMRMWRAGARLTQNVKRSRVTDLVIPSQN